jgi:hypothetical protein
MGIAGDKPCQYLFPLFSNLVQVKYPWRIDQFASEMCYPSDYGYAPAVAAVTAGE